MIKYSVAIPININVDVYSDLIIESENVLTREQIIDVCKKNEHLLEVKIQEYEIDYNNLLYVQGSDIKKERK